MTLSPTNPGYLVQCTLTKKLAGRVAQPLRDLKINEYFAACFCNSVISAFNNTGFIC